MNLRWARLVPPKGGKKPREKKGEGIAGAGMGAGLAAAGMAEEMQEGRRSTADATRHGQDARAISIGREC